MGPVRPLHLKEPGDQVYLAPAFVTNVIFCCAQRLLTDQNIHLQCTKKSIGGQTPPRPTGEASNTPLTYSWI